MKFFIADYAQIEARITLWLAEDEETLDLIRSGKSVYEVHAIRTMGYDPSKGSLKKVDPSLYQLAKARVLGLGFGCGHVRFVDLAKKLCGLELDITKSLETVRDFRNTNPKICTLWNQLHRKLQNATRTESRLLKLDLKSGRAVKYFDIHMADKDIKGRRERGGTYYRVFGPLLLENIVQATGFDILAEAMVNADETFPEYPIVMSVHDELVFEVPEDISEENKAQLAETMTQLPDWTNGLPLNVEVFLADHYCK
jgi:DNA polymerase